MLAESFGTYLSVPDSRGGFLIRYMQAKLNRLQSGSGPKAVGGTYPVELLPEGWRTTLELVLGTGRLQMYPPT